MIVSVGLSSMSRLADTRMGKGLAHANVVCVCVCEREREGERERERERERKREKRVVSKRSMATSMADARDKEGRE